MALLTALGVLLLLFEILLINEILFNIFEVFEAFSVLELTNTDVLIVFLESFSFVILEMLKSLGGNLLSELFRPFAL